MAKYSKVEPCKKCRKPIAWLKHKTSGRTAPIETRPVENGNILVRFGLYRVATEEERQKAKQIGKLLFLNHFAACPFANEFRPKKEVAHEK